MSSYRAFYGEELFDLSKTDEIINFKYQGSDNSYYYRYFMSPLCDYLVNNWIPEWIAFPNKTQHSSLIRSPLSDFFWSILHSYYYFYFINLHCTLLWSLGSTFCLQSLCLSIKCFQKILDNCDGKQARKTGNSSTLGMLFDHGCDNITLLCNSFVVLSIMGLTGYEFSIFVVYLSASFYLPTLEQ